MKVVILFLVASSLVFVQAQFAARTSSRGRVTFEATRTGTNTRNEPARISRPRNEAVAAATAAPRMEGRSARPVSRPKVIESRIDQPSSRSITRPRVESPASPKVETRAIRTRSETGSKIEARAIKPKVDSIKQNAVVNKPKVEAIPLPETKAKAETRLQIEKPDSNEEDIPNVELSPKLEATPAITEINNLKVMEVIPKPIASSNEVNDNKINGPVDNCQQNDVLSRLLLRVLLSSVMTTTQNPLVENLNRLFNIKPSPPPSPTTLVTSTAVSTITQLFSTIVSVMFMNRKVPTTIYSSSTMVVTELQTITSTLPFTEPSLFRFKREAAGEDELQSSILEENSISKLIEPTQPLSTAEFIKSQDPLEPAVDIDRLVAVLNHPEIREAWNQFLQVLHRVLE